MIAGYWVRGYCAGCGSRTLFIANDGRVICGSLPCPDPKRRAA